MIIIMKQEIQEGSPEMEQLDKVAARYPELKLQLHNVGGSLQTISEVYVYGPTRQVPVTVFEELPFVQKVFRVSTKYKIIGRHDLLCHVRLDGQE